MGSLVVDAEMVAHLQELEELCMLTGDFERALQYRIFAQEARDGVLWQAKEGADDRRV